MFPEVLTVNYIISQAIGLVVIVLSLASYFVGTKRKQLLLVIISNILISISFLFLGTYVACIGIVIATIRTIIFFVYELRLKQVPVWVISMIFLVLIFNSAIFMKTPMDLLPMFSLMLFTLGFKIRKLVYMRIFFIVPIIMFLLYDLTIFAYSDIVLNILQLAVISVTTTRFFIRKARLDRIRATEELQGGMEEISDD